MKRPLRFATLILLTLTACNTLEKEIQGGWVVDQAYYNNEPLIWNMYGNGVNFKQDNTCILPAINDLQTRTKEEREGKWDVSKKDDKSYLKITTSNEVFNRTFEIHNLRKVQDSVSWGHLMKMTLIADSLKLECTKAL